MKKLILIVCAAIASMTLFAQANTELSDAGKRHYKAAMTLLELASTIEEYKTIANEFEWVAERDPNYADTYFELGKIYTKLGKEYGEPYFQKAKDAFKKYKDLRPDEANTVDDEIYAIDLVDKTSAKARLEKKKAAYVGLWKGNFYHTIMISNTDGELKVEDFCSGRSLNVFNVHFTEAGLSFESAGHNSYGKESYDSCGKWKGTCDADTENLKWTCKLIGDSMSISCDYSCVYWLRGRKVGECSDFITDTYKKQ